MVIAVLVAPSVAATQSHVSAATDCDAWAIPVFCDDFERSHLGSAWKIHRPDASLVKGKAVLSAPNFYAAMSYAADTQLGDGILHLRWNPQEIPASYKQLLVSFRATSYTDDNWAAWHSVLLRPDEADVCMFVPSGKRCVGFAWAAREYHLEVHHHGGSLDLLVDGTHVLSASYPANEPATRLLVQVSDNGSGHAIEVVAYTAPVPPASECTWRTSFVFCDDFNRRTLGPNWTATAGARLRSGALLMTGDPSGPGGGTSVRVEYLAHRELGDGTVSLSWNPRQLAPDWKQVRIDLEQASWPLAGGVHTVWLRPDEGDVCVTVDTILDSICARFRWAAKEYKVDIHQHGGLLQVVLDGVRVLTVPYAPTGTTTSLSITGNDDGSGQVIGFVAFHAAR